MEDQECIPNLKKTMSGKVLGVELLSSLSFKTSIPLESFPEIIISSTNNQDKQVANDEQRQNDRK